MVVDADLLTQFIGEDPGVVGPEKTGFILKSAANMAFVMKEKAIGHE